MLNNYDSSYNSFTIQYPMMCQNLLGMAKCADLGQTSPSNVSYDNHIFPDERRT